MSEWKAGDWGMVLIVGADDKYVSIDSGCDYPYVLSPLALHPLPAMAPEDTAIIEAATEVEKRIAQVKSGGAAVHGLYFAALEKLYAAVHSRNATLTLPQQETKMKQVPQDSAWQPASSPDIPALERAVVEAKDAVIAVVESHVSPEGFFMMGVVDHVNHPIGNAVMALRAALNPAPVDRVAELREAVENAAIRLRVDAMILRANRETQGANEADDAADRLRAALAAIGEK